MKNRQISTARGRQSILSAFAVGLSLWSIPFWVDPAAARPVKCELTIDKHNHAEGPCDFAPQGTDGSFILSARSGIFAYVIVNKAGVADASWNETPSSTHAQAPLGEVRREGACWSNARAKICSWAMDKTPAPPPAAPPPSQAAPKAGALVLPEFDGGLTCMIAQTPKKGAKLTIGKDAECAGPNAQFVIDEEIVHLAQDRSLCVASNDQANLPAFLGDCASASLLIYNSAEHWVGAVAGEFLCLGLKGKPKAVESGQIFISKSCASVADQKIMFQPAPAQAASAPADERNFATLGKWTLAQVARQGVFQSCVARFALDKDAVASLSLTAKDEWSVSAPASLPDRAVDGEFSPRGAHNTQRDRAEVRAGQIIFSNIGEALANAILSGGGFGWRAGAAAGDISLTGGAQILERLHDCVANGRKPS